jgi:hypothetical protein
LAFVLFGMILFAQGCGGGGGGSSAAAEPAPVASSSQTGELRIAITDAAGDFAKYEIDVLQLTLERANGETVATLPLSTRVDFADLTEITEFLSVATVPAGNYQSVTVRLDFTDADIWVQTDGDDTQAVAVADDGSELGELEVRLQLTSSDVIRIRSGIPAAFSLDFDLNASNEVDLDVMPPEVTVDPFLLATPELELDREHRVRGTLENVDVDNEQFTLLVRPFRHRTGEFGELDVMVTDETRYEVDGEGFVGALGLAALDGNPRVIASGSITSEGLTADTVLVGSSVPMSEHSVIKGVVAARDGNLLTIRGAHRQFADGKRDFRGVHNVLLGDDTTVTAPGVDSDALTIQSVSVGQRIVAWGAVSEDDMFADGALDVRAGRVRLKMNQLTAQVVQAAPLAVDLFALNGRQPASYDFSGTGISSDDDADINFYEVDTGVLNLDISDGDIVRVRGLVSESGVAPHDFSARSVIDVDSDMRAAQLQVAWLEGTVTPFTSIEPQRIDVDLTQARKLLKLRGVPRDAIEGLDAIALTAPDSGQGVYAVKIRGAGEMHVHRSFAGLVDELVEQLDSGRKLHRIGVTGRYNTLNHELTTGRASFVLTAPEEVD